MTPLLRLLSLPVAVSLALSTSGPPTAPSFVILGGAGRIGTAVASHLLRIAPPDSKMIVLVGRNKQQGERAVEEVLSEENGQVEFRFVQDCWDAKELRPLIETVGADCLIHTAGPYLGQDPAPLQVAIECGCKTYVDVSDPLDYLEASLALNDKAVASGTTAVLASGAFPGLSNILAVEAASKVDDSVKDVRFNYFTAGLGGSGDVNLYITNLGFGEPMNQFEGGKLRSFEALSGLLLGKVDFSLNSSHGFGDEEMSRRVGQQTVFSWPFPEAATVPKELQASGDSHAGMGTAPDAWNVMLGLLVDMIPRSWWRSERFSKFLADFSQPLVKATDALLKLTSPDSVGETHAMRIDVTGQDGRTISIVQGHESFRRCVGQSCAEFAMDAIQHPSAGVALPEQRYKNDIARQRIIDRLTGTAGTFAYSRPVAVEGNPTPTNLVAAVERAIGAE